MGFIYLIILVRGLSKTELGGYFAFYAYVEIALIISGLAVVQILERYIPNLYADHNDIFIGKLANKLLSLRVFLLLVFIGITLLWHEPILHMLDLHKFKEAFFFINGIMFLEGICRYIDSFHDSILNQQKSQFSILFRTSAKLLLLILITTVEGEITLSRWLQVEFVAMLAAVIFSIQIYIRTLLRIGKNLTTPEKSPKFSQYFKYGFVTFSAQVISILISFDMLQLVVLKLYGLDVAALFSFCLSLAFMVQRYLPSNLFASVIRPIFVAAGRKINERNDSLSQYAFLILKLNLFFLLPIILMTLFYGNEILAIISGEKFLEENNVLIFLLILIGLRSFKSIQILVLSSLDGLWGIFLGPIVALLIFVVLGVFVWKLGVDILLLSLIFSEILTVAINFIFIKYKRVSQYFDYMPFLKLVGLNVGIIFMFNFFISKIEHSAIEELVYISLGCGFVMILNVKKYFNKLDVILINEWFGVNRYFYFIKRFFYKNKFIFGNKNFPVVPNQVNIFYWQYPSNDKENIGDILGPIIVNYFLNKASISEDCECKTATLTTIGSVINIINMPATVWGSGWRSESSRPPSTSSLDIRAVRGPITREKLLSYGIDCPEIYGDPAIFLPEIYFPKIKVTRKYILIPHFSHDHKYMADQEHFVSTLTSNWKDFIDLMLSAEVIVTGSLHAYILAEVYGKRVALIDLIDEDTLKYSDYHKSIPRNEKLIIYSSVEEAIKNAKSVPASSFLDSKTKLRNVFPFDLWSPPPLDQIDRKL